MYDEYIQKPNQQQIPQGARPFRSRKQRPCDAC